MRGYAERIVRKEFERRGIVVWRGGFVHARRSERYPNVERKYARLERIVEERYPGTLEELQYLSSTQHGMPDLVTWNGSALRFVEVKLDYEPISERQRSCMMRLSSLGFSVVIARVVSRSTRLRESEIDLETREEHEKNRQLRLDAF